MRFVVKEMFLFPPNQPFEFFLKGDSVSTSFILGGDFPRVIFFDDILPGEYLVNGSVINSDIFGNITCHVPIDNNGTFSVDGDSVTILYQPGDTFTCVYEYGFLLFC